MLRTKRGRRSSTKNILNLREMKSNQMDAQYFTKLRHWKHQLRSFISPCAILYNKIKISNTTATLVISGITWGGISIVNIVVDKPGNATFRTNKKMLKVEVEKLCSCMKSETIFEENDLRKKCSLSFYSYSDVLNGVQLPTTLAAAQQYLMQSSKRIQDLNQGIGKPLVFTLTPTSKLATQFGMDIVINLQLNMTGEVQRVQNAFNAITKAKVVLQTQQIY